MLAEATLYRGLLKATVVSRIHVNDQCAYPYGY